MLFIDWNPSIEAFRIGSFAMRWYALCWLIGLLAAYFIVRRLYIQQKIKETLFEPLFIYCFLGILIGARLGHCLFYEPDYFLSSGQHIVEMLIPIRFLPDGGWRFTGYAGLASHGGTIGLIITLLLYVRKTKLNHMDGARQHRHSNAYNGVFHKAWQPDELGDNRKSDRCAMGIRVPAGGHAAKTPGAAV